MPNELKLCEGCISMFREGGYNVLAAPGRDKSFCDNCKKKLYSRPVKLISKRKEGTT